MAGPTLTNLVHPIIFPKHYHAPTQKVDAEDADDIFYDCQEEFDAPVTLLEPQKLASRVVNKHTIEIEEDSEFFDARDSFEEDVATPGDPLWVRCADKVVDVVMDVVASKTANKLNTFSQTIVGSKLLWSSIAFVGHKTGMAVGAAFPEATVGFTVGRAIANKVTPESENKSTIVQAAGIFAGLTATTLTTSLQLLTGTPGYMMQMGGTIAGGMNGLMATGQEVPDGYIPRTAASLFATDVVGEAISSINSIASFISVPSAVSTTITVAGEVLSTVSGRMGYYTPELIQLASQKGELEEETKQLAKPAEFFNRVVIEAGGSEALAVGIANYLDLAAVKDFVHREKQDNIAKETNKLIAEIIAASIDSKVGANTFVRAVNSFAKLFNTKDIQNDIEQLNECADVSQKQLLIQALKRKLILNVLEGAYEKESSVRTNKLCDLLMNKFESCLDVLSPIMQEIDDIGIHIYSEKTKDLLSIIAPALLLLIPINASHEQQAPKELSESENRDFYNNIADLALTILTPHKENILRSGFKWISREALIWKLTQDKNFLATTAMKIGKKLKETLKLKPVLEAPNTEQKIPDPASIIQTVVAQVAGGPQVFSTVALKALELQPLVEKMVGIFMDKSLISTKAGTNAIVRALNEYATLIQDPAIQDRIKKLKTWKDPQKRKGLKVVIGQKIASKINAKYSRTEGLLSGVMQYLSTTQIDQMIEKFVTAFEANEKKFLGELTSREAHKDLLDVYLPPLFSLITIYATRGVKENLELTKTELEAFYGNLENIIFSPYEGFMIVKDLRKLVDGSIPMILKRTTFIPDIISKLVEDTLASTITQAVKSKAEVELKKPRFIYFLSLFSRFNVGLISFCSRLLLPFIFKGRKARQIMKP